MFQYAIMALANGLGGHLLQGLGPSLLRSSFSTVQVQFLILMIIVGGISVFFLLISTGFRVSSFVSLLKALISDYGVVCLFVCLFVC